MLAIVIAAAVWVIVGSCIAWSLCWVAAGSDAAAERLERGNHHD